MTVPRVTPNNTVLLRVRGVRLSATIFRAGRGPVFVLEQFPMVFGITRSAAMLDSLVGPLGSVWYARRIQ